MSTATEPLDLKEVRANFPALSRDQVFFDNAGGSQTLGTVIDSIKDYLSNTNVQLGASYSVATESTGKYNAGYKAAAKFINATPDSIVIGPSTTQLFRNVSYALNFSAGEELVLSEVDHEANIAPWVALAERQGLTIKWWKPAAGTTKLEASQLDGLLSPRTRLVALTHASNVLGTIHDVKAVAAAAHARSPSALVCVDGVALAPHRPIDVGDLGVDLYAFSWYKAYGPHVAQLYASAAALGQLGRGLGHYFNPSATLEDKLGLAAGSYELLQSLPHVLAYLGPPPNASTGDTGRWAPIARQEHALCAILLGYLNTREDVTVHGERSASPDVRVPTVSFTVKGWNSQELVEAVEKESRFGFRWGAFYSNRLVENILGLDRAGVVRVSMVHYNTTEEVKAFVEALDKVLEKGGSGGNADNMPKVPLRQA